MSAWLLLEKLFDAIHSCPSKLPLYLALSYLISTNPDSVDCLDVSRDYPISSFPNTRDLPLCLHYFPRSSTIT